MPTFYTKFDSPVGNLYLVSDQKFLKAIIFQKNWYTYKKGMDLIKSTDSLVINKTISQLREYFAGKRKKFNIKCKPEGTDFQLKVWNALSEIPYGKTSSYKEQAEVIKNKKAVRAVGRADGQNPICIIYPCHRVIGSNGKLTGFAGGLKAKKFMLKLEGLEF